MPKYQGQDVKIVRQATDDDEGFAFNIGNAEQVVIATPDGKEQVVPRAVLQE